MLIWEGTPKGRYLVASAYKAQYQMDTKLVWAKAWYHGLIPKINIFFWLLLQNRILTLDNLMKRGHIMPNRCILCKNQAETVDHIFIHCSFSREIWT